MDSQHTATTAEDVEMTDSQPSQISDTQREPIRSDDEDDHDHDGMKPGKELARLGSFWQVDGWRDGQSSYGCFKRGTGKSG